MKNHNPLLFTICSLFRVLLLLVVALAFHRSVFAKSGLANGLVSKILFIEYYNGYTVLSMMDPGKENITPLVQVANSAYFLSLSPDGKLIAYTGRVNKHEAILVMNVDGSHQHTVKELSGAEAFGDFSPGWAADSKRLVYASTDGQELYTINLDGSDNQKLVLDVALSSVMVLPAGSPDDTVVMDFPAWSPDGKHIIFQAANINETKLFITDSDGKHTHRFSDISVGNRSDAAWSPDGTKVAFPGLPDPKNPDFRAIFVANADGSGAHPVTSEPSPLSPHKPVWSPDGNQIAFIDDSGIRLMNADGTNLHTLVQAKPHIVYDVTWGLVPADLLANLPPIQTLVPTP